MAIPVDVQDRALQELGRARQNLTAAQRRVGLTAERLQEAQDRLDQLTETPAVLEQRKILTRGWTAHLHSQPKLETALRNLSRLERAVELAVLGDVGYRIVNGSLAVHIEWDELPAAEGRAEQVIVITTGMVIAVSAAVVLLGTLAAGVIINAKLIDKSGALDEMDTQAAADATAVGDYALAEEIRGRRDRRHQEDLAVLKQGQFGFLDRLTAQFGSAAKWGVILGAGILGLAVLPNAKQALSLGGTNR